MLCAFACCCNGNKNQITPFHSAIKCEKIKVCIRNNAYTYLYKNSFLTEKLVKRVFNLKLQIHQR